MSEALPSILSKEELRELVREVLDERQELVGLPAASAEERVALKEDAMFVRKMRRAADGVASKVGYAIIMSIFTIIGGLVVAGFGSRFGH